MANFIVAVDPDNVRRDRFLSSIAPLIEPVDGLKVGTCSAGEFSALWAILPNAPFSKSVDDLGAAVIWGEAIVASGPRRLAASELRQPGQGQSGGYGIYDGYHAVVTYDRDAGFYAAADLLGLFPLYYFYDNGVLLVGSSPELMRWHPSFKKQLDPEGLIGLLLTNGLFDGRTLWQNVRRLSAGHALVWRQGRHPREVEHYRIPISARYIDVPYSGVSGLLDHALTNATARHAPTGDQYGLLLSGGLDSRMLAGYLKDNGNNITALTTGVLTDIEMRCAVKVARALGFKHKSVDVTPEQYPACAEIAAKWEHLAGGFSMISSWGMLPQLRASAPRVITGYLGDAIVGGSHITWAYSATNRSMEFEHFFVRQNSWGIEPEALKRLLATQEHRELVEHVLSRITRVYEDYADFEFQRAWCFDLHHRQRFHVGHVAWQVSFGAWPVMPVIDREVLEIVAGLPAAVIADRRAQNTLVSERFPLLARLPLDRSSDDDRPLSPRIRQQLAWPVKVKLESLLQYAQSLAGTPTERRYIYRIMDFNWAGWQTVRQHAEPYRNQLFDVLVEAELEKVVPPPGCDARPKEILAGSAAAKNLVGLMLFDRQQTPPFDRLGERPCVSRT